MVRAPEVQKYCFNRAQRKLIGDTCIQGMGALSQILCFCSYTYYFSVYVCSL